MLYVEKCLSSCPSSRLFVTFLPEKMLLSPAKNINSPSVCVEKKHSDGQPSRRYFSELSPRKQPPALPVRENLERKTKL